MVDVPLIVPQDSLSLDRYLVPRGLQDGENPLPDDNSDSGAAGSAAALPPLNATAYEQLQEMGFPANRAEKALRMTGNSNADVAMQWLFEHMDDPDFDLPYEAPAAGSQSAIDEDSVTNLIGMGFEDHMAKKALRETVHPYFGVLSSNN
jgi:ubiquitin carboxyl-terminal hydrolase 5/13